MIMLPKATRVMSDRQPIALIGHDVAGTGDRMGNLPGLPPKVSFTYTTSSIYSNKLCFNRIKGLFQ